MAVLEQLVTMQHTSSLYDVWLILKDKGLKQMSDYVMSIGYR